MTAMILHASLAVLAATTDIELDAEPNWYEKPYTPADAATVTRNPPPFIWRPPKDDLSYVLELSTTDDFATERRRVEDIAVSTVALGEPLVPGRWFWRYGVRLDDGDVTFSKARSFTVPEDAWRFPYPDMDAVVASIPLEHPRLFILRGELDAYRQRARDGDLKGVRDQLTRACDKYLGQDLVEEPPYVTGKGPERGKNYCDIFRATRPPMDRMEQSALTYLLTEDERYGNEAKRRILHFFGWDPEGPTAYKHNDEPAMWVMMRGVRAYDWTYDLFSPEERAKVEGVMHIRAAQFYQHLKYRRRFHTNPHESHAGRTLGFLGEAALAFAHEWPESPEWLDYVMTLFWNIYPAWGKDDGGWHEGPGYWSAYMSFALHFVVPLRNATGADLMQRPFFRNTPYYLLYTNPPYAKISPFGDGESGASSGGKGSLMYQFASLLEDPYVRSYADAWKRDGGAGMLGVVLKDDALRAKSPAELPQARHFPGVGLVSLHTALGNAPEDVHFLIHSDPYGPISHAHADENAFTLEAFGEPLAIASGYYPWYGSNHHSKWSWESKSSNTITFDGGIGQKIRDAKSKGAIRAFRTTDDYDYVVADATQAYQGRLTKFIRKVVHVRPGVFVLFDDLAAPAPVTFEWRLHARSEMALDESTQRVTVAQGEARLDLHFVQPQRVALSQTTGFDFPPERGDYPDQWHLVASPPEKLGALRYLTVLVPYKAGAQDQRPSMHAARCDGGLGVKLADAQGAHYVAFRTGDSAEVAIPGVTTSTADVLAVHVNAEGKIDRQLD